MRLDISFNVVEPFVKRYLPSHPYAPAWVTMYLEQRAIERPTEEQMHAAVRAYMDRAASAQHPDKAD